MADVRTIRVEDNAITQVKASAGTRKLQTVQRAAARQWLLTATGGFGTPTATAAETNEFNDGAGYYGQYFRQAGDATILGPKLSYSTGLLDISGDQTGAEGTEFCPGGISPLNPFGLTVNGTTAVAKFNRVIGIPTTVANVGNFMVGFRKNQAFQADYNDYTDLFALSLAAGTVNLVKILNNATTVTTDTTLTVADAGLADFQVTVDVNGRAHAFFRGIELGQGLPNSGVGLGAPFSFDTTDFLVPFFIFTHATAATVFGLTQYAVGDAFDLISRPTVTA